MQAKNKTLVFTLFRWQFSFRMLHLHILPVFSSTTPVLGLHYVASLNT